MINLLKKKFMVILILVVIMFNFTTSISIVLATDEAGAGTDAGADTGEPAPEQIFNEEEAKEAEEGVWGEEGESLNGGVLYKSFIKFTTGIGDIFIKFLQKSFLGEEFKEIQNGEEYGILYSPATIFSGKIPAFDINFISPQPFNIKVEKIIEQEHVNTYKIIATENPESTERIFEKNYASYEDGEDAFYSLYKGVNPDTGEEFWNLTDYTDWSTPSTSVYDSNIGDIETTYSSTKYGGGFCYRITTITNTGYDEEGEHKQENEKFNIAVDRITEATTEGVEFDEARDIIMEKLLGEIPSSQTYETYEDNGDYTYTEKNGEWRLEIDVKEVAGGLVGNDYIGRLYTKAEGIGSAPLNKVSVASILQGPVSKWYAATRTIALVGLLSGIVYIGIRIITSSTGKEQAKYKQWIMNWVAAICLLFILHYLMAGIIKITQEISEIFIAEIAGDENTIEADEFMTGIRTTLGEEPSKYSNFPELVIYIALVIYTLIFTFHYLKRVVYMAFLTMVAPLIALTYPIDKIKDSKSQAFDMWLKEYIYNALLQVMHLILYFVFIHSATELVDQNPIYAIITIGFFVPAEKFIKKMFGFNNQESMGEFEAAAGGALTMNAINEVSKFANSKGSAPEGASNKSGGNQQPQGGTNINFSNSGGAWNNGMPPAGGGPNGGSDSESDDNGGLPQTGTPPAGGPQAGAPSTEQDTTSQSDSVEPNDFDTSTGGNNGGVNPNGGAPHNATPINTAMPIGGETPINTKGHRKPRTIEGVKNLAKKKRFGRKVLKGMFKIPLATIGALTMGTIGLAAGVATGDPSKAFTFASAGFVAGKKVGGAVVDRAIGIGSSIKKDVETFRQGYEGTEYDDKERERQNAKFLKDGEAIQKYRANFEDYEEAMRLAIRFRNEGITDDNKIISAIKIGESEGQSVETMINAVQHESMISNSAYQKKSSREEYRTRMKSGIHRNLQLRNNPRNDDEITNKNMETANDQSIKMMRLIGRLKNYDF